MYKPVERYLPNQSPTSRSCLDDFCKDGIANCEAKNSISCQSIFLGTLMQERESLFLLTTPLETHDYPSSRCEGDEALSLIESNLVDEQEE